MFHQPECTGNNIYLQLQYIFPGWAQTVTLRPLTQVSSIHAVKFSQSYYEHKSVYAVGFVSVKL